MKFLFTALVINFAINIGDAYTERVVPLPLIEKIMYDNILIK